MNNLGLPHPKLMDIAVPANLRCGKPEQETELPDGPIWAPLTFTFAGVWEIQAHALEENAAKIQIVDVREPDEYAGPLGRIHGSRLIPLGQLPQRTGELARDRPIVTVCRSGARSAQASVLLQKAGFADVANLAGGMLRWRAEGHPVEGARE
jgi:rhodanese-related sulfurtransferase